MRHLILPNQGVLLVNTDIHGNLEDFEALASCFEREITAEPETHWVILGDIVHAPNDDARKENPELYDFDDGSMAIADRILALQERYPGHVHFVLGNHDHAHVGGAHTGKFYDDEVVALESKLSPEEVARLHGLFNKGLLAVVAPCGLLMTHGSPDRGLVDVAALDGVNLDNKTATYAHRMMTRALLTAYGQPDHEAKVMLEAISKNGGFDVRVVIHGHDRDERGFFREGTTQVCPVIFGAPRANKRYLRIDLAARFDNAEALREDIEIRRLFPAA